jgi:hypothetical protein
MKRILVAVLVAMSIQLARSTEAAAVIDRPNADSGPTKISVGIWVVDINKIDSAEQTFTAEVALVLRWKDPRLTHTGSGVVRYPLEQIWHARAGIANETNSVRQRFPESAEVEPDGTVLYRQLYTGAFTQSLRLQSFPFDRQTFHVQLVAVRYQPDEIRFVPDQDWIRNGLKQASGIAPKITLPDWTIEKWETKPLTYALAPGLQYSSYAFEFTASRKRCLSPMGDRHTAVSHFSKTKKEHARRARAMWMPFVVTMANRAPPVADLIYEHTA